MRLLDGYWILVAFKRCREVKLIAYFNRFFNDLIYVLVLIKKKINFDVLLFI